MNWNAVGAVAELIAAIGVIVSLLYLAAQVRHGTAVARRNAAHELLDTTSPLLFAIAENPEVASIWTRGLADYDSLEDVEKVRFSTLMLNLTYSWEESWHALRSGQVDEWTYQRFTASRRELTSLPGFRTWFERRRDWIGDEFRALLEDDFRGDPVRSPLYDSSGRDAGSATGSARDRASTA